MIGFERNCKSFKEMIETGKLFLKINKQFDTHAKASQVDIGLFWRPSTNYLLQTVYRSQLAFPLRLTTGHKTLHKKRAAKKSTKSDHYSK